MVSHSFKVDLLTGGAPGARRPLCHEAREGQRLNADELGKTAMHLSRLRSPIMGPWTRVVSLRLQRNTLTNYKVSGLRIEDLKISTVEQTWLRPPIELFQTLSHFLAACFLNIAKFTIPTVESKDRQQVASQSHDIPRGIQFIRLGERGFNWRELLSGYLCCPASSAYTGLSEVSAGLAFDGTALCPSPTVKWKMGCWEITNTGRGL
jgi:hypothetical protein